MSVAVTHNSYWRIRLAKGAPWSALRVWDGYPTDPVTGDTLTERPLLWRATLNGEDVDIAEVIVEFDGLTKLPVVKGEQIDAGEYEYLLQTLKWAKAYTPTDALANPRKRIDMNKIAPIKF